MIELDLNSAIDILSLQEYSEMTVEERKNMIEEEGFEEEEIFEYIRNRYIGIKLSYIEKKIRSFYQLPINVNGTPKGLLRCFCCDYKTILERGNYQICKICFWEDDVGNDLSRYSHVNHMTLQEAKDNFRLKRISSEKFLKFVDTDRELKYYKDNSRL